MPYKYTFGPVPSRRLGLSLGVDLVPLKTCTQNCIYCQLGIDGTVTTSRKEYVPIDEILDELRARIADGLTSDYITLSGSGEPTLHSGIGRLITEIKKITSIPVAILTNGTLLSISQVRTDCAKADVVLPNLDAGDERTFAIINRPHSDIKFSEFVDGLVKFRSQYAGQIWLEVFLVEGINTDEEQLAKIKTIVERIKPDKVQLNTAVRPTAQTGLEAVGPERMAAIAAKLGAAAEVVADYPQKTAAAESDLCSDNIMDMLRRRPCCLDDICAGMKISKLQASKYLGHLKQQGLIITELRGGNLFFKPK